MALGKACAPENRPSVALSRTPELALSLLFQFWHAHCSFGPAVSSTTFRQDYAAYLGRIEKVPPEEEQKEVQEKPKSKKLLIILPLLVVLLGGGGAGAYFKFFRAPDEGAVEKKQEESFVYHEMDTFMANLADPGGKRFLKATIKLKVSSPQVGEECKLRSFEMRDLVLTLLTSKESEDVIRPEDKLILKKQIIEALNRVLQKGQALDVYFTDFLVQ